MRITMVAIIDCHEDGSVSSTWHGPVDRSVVEALVGLPLVEQLLSAEDWAKGKAYADEHGTPGVLVVRDDADG